MYHVQVDLQCTERLSEILLDDRASAEAHLKNLARHILQEFFAVVAIERVSIRRLSDTPDGLKHFSIQITAHCMSAAHALPALERLELALEDRVSCTLLELVERVDIEDVSIENAPPGAPMLSLP